VQQLQETVNVLSNATGTVLHDWSLGSIFWHNTIQANFTANISNVPLTVNKAYVVTLVLSNGATGYFANALQVNGSATTIRYFNNTPPSPSVNKIDIQSFTLFYTGTTPSWYALSQFTSFN
jgi:hypothetical protein